MHKNNKIKAVIAFAVALAFLAPGSAVFASDEGTFADNTIVSIDPATLPVEKDMSFTVDVYVIPGDVTGNPEGITGVQCDLYFNQTLIRADLVTEGDIFSGYNTWFGPGTIDNVNGKIDDIYNTILDDAAHSDPGVFVTISFTSLDKLGTSPLDLDEVIVIDYDGDPVIVDVNDGSVTVEEFFSLTISVDGSGETVPAAGAHTYPSGEIVSLVATADPGWTFDSWTGDVADPSSATTTIEMLDDEVISALFTEDEYILTVTPDGNGHVDVDPLETFYRYGDEPVLTAVADPGWTFDSWSVDLTGDINPTPIFMDGHKAVTATFEEDWYDLTITINGNGSVGVSPPGPYRYDDPVTLDPEADLSWSFSGWSGDLSGNADPATIIMDDNKAVTATFQEEWFREIMIAEDTLILTDMADWVTFGETMTAKDGLDGQDLEYPYMPPDPYVVAFFKTDFDSPFDRLERDIRKYPGVNPYEKVWDLWVMADDGEGGTTEIAMTWDLVVNEYDSVGLYDKLTGELIVDMEAVGEFKFTAHSYGYIHKFQIKCSWNHIPVANDDYYTTNENDPLIVLEPDGVLDNDVDDDGPYDLTASLVIDPAKPAKGTLTYFNSDGSFEYVPNPGVTGADSFVYEITDGYPDPLHTVQATVHITIVDLKDIEVNVGWNLISIPAYEENFDKTNLIIEYGGDHYTWDDAIDIYILEFTYGWDNGAYVDGALLTRGDGYWLWAIVDCTILVPSNAEAEDHITTFDDGEGWYLVGAPYTINLERWNTRINQNAISYTWNQAAVDDIIEGNLFDWNREKQNYELSLDTGSFFEPGRGYWTYVYEPCSLNRA